MSAKRQSQREYLAALNAARFVRWDEVTGQSYEADTDPEYWQDRDHSYSASPVATVEPDARVQPCSVEPLRVSDAPGLFAATYAARLRRVFADAQSAQRDAVKPALAALSVVLSPADAKFDASAYPTRVAALEALYASYRQSAREIASLMQRAPHDGRPPMAVRVPSTVAAMQVRHSDRWQSTPMRASDCMSLHTVPMQRGEHVHVSDEWRAAIDRGIVPTVFSAAAVKPERSRTSGKVAPTVSKRRARHSSSVSAASLPPVFAD